MTNWIYEYTSDNAISNRAHAVSTKLDGVDATASRALARFHFIIIFVCFIIVSDNYGQTIKFLFSVGIFISFSMCLLTNVRQRIPNVVWIERSEYEYAPMSEFAATSAELNFAVMCVNHWFEYKLWELTRIKRITISNINKTVWPLTYRVKTVSDWLECPSFSDVFLSFHNSFSSPFFCFFAFSY